MDAHMRYGLPKYRVLISIGAGCLICILLITGCMFRSLKRNVTYLKGMVFIGGKVSWDDEAAPLLVLLIEGKSGKVLDSYLMIKPGSFYFVVPEGIYRIAAFVDVNRDFTYQPDQEPAAFFGNPTDVQVSADRETQDINFYVAKNSRTRLDIPAIAIVQGSRGSGVFPNIHVGEVVKIDDPRFATENGKLGLWQPSDFMFKIGAGIYFLEAYSPRKMPVIFIHGAGGTPSDWQYLVNHLDRTKFQPWLVYYPSGLRNDVSAQGIARWTEALAARYGTQRFVVVAHSMGGLLARAAINRVVGEGGGGKLAAFVTLSTPWTGHAAAKTGVEHAPVVVPSWYDMAPGSPFLTGLFRTSMPPQCPYYLLFSYNGNTRVLNEPNDGGVALSSELNQDAQRIATKIYGFKENHESILKSHEVSRTLNAILAEVSHLDGKE